MDKVDTIPLFLLLLRKMRSSVLRAEKVWLWDSAGPQIFLMISLKEEDGKTVRIMKSLLATLPPILNSRAHTERVPTFMTSKDSISVSSN